MLPSGWIDTLAEPPRRLPDSVNDAIEYLSGVLGTPVYQIWTPATLARRHASMNAAKTAQPDVFRLLLDAPEVVQFWHAGAVVALARDEAPDPEQTLSRLLRTLSFRFRPVQTQKAAHPPGDGSVRDTRRRATPVPVLAEADRQWLARTGRLFNTDHSTNTLSATDDATALVAFMADRTRGSPHTRRAYATELRRFIAWCRSQDVGPLSGLSRENLLAYHQALPGITAHAMAKTLGPSSCARALAVVKSLYQFWSRTGYLRVNPAVRLGDTSSRNTTFEPKRFLTDRATHAVDRWIAGWLHEKSTSPTRNRRALVLALYRYTGARCAELASEKGFPKLLVSGTDWSLELMGKGQRMRRIPLPTRCIQCIQRYRESRGLPAVPSPIEDMPLIPAKCGHGLGRSGLYREVKAAFEEIADGLPQNDVAGRLAFHAASTHWLRHSYIHHLVVKHGVPLPAAQALAGHASVQTTASYARTDQSQLRKFVNESFCDELPVSNPPTA
ncbi:tyrosine-type recombinase/integrase [Paraburkholderia phenazinium]|uniref:tyrosine-type recombinase/integrase n=1 Tax=Paraburkholderia phenazinium TaxID=60549 RepID=UPI00158A2FC9|nr:tyrosine-type recombinase/integrase [Paraburkholderia phenazinium]